MQKYQFLSDEWWDAVESLVSGQPDGSPAHQDFAVNLTVYDAPGGPQTFSFGARNGRAFWRRTPDVDARLEFVQSYETAKRVWVTTDKTAGLMAIKRHKMIVNGPLAEQNKAFALAGHDGPQGGNRELHRQIIDITE